MTVGTFRQLIGRCDGNVGAEFALIVPLFILFLLGIIDVGRYMYSVNQLEKATQMGARMAVVTNMVPGGLASTNYGLTLGQGASIPTSSFGAAQCQKPANTVTCTCPVTPCPTLTPVDSTAFNAVVTRMRLIARMINANNVTIRYDNSGLGYAGDPNGPDVAPIVTVRVQGVRFVPLIFQFFGASLTLPSERASLVLEDGAGSTSN
jgi:Flp pilus assembly protein TadG